MGEVAEVKTYSVILADPAWAYRVGGVQGDVDEQYPTMSLSELAAIPVASWAAPDCVLACWATWPKLDEAIHLIDRWGFDYVTGLPWIKTISATIRRGIGFWTQGVSEPLLIGRRGNPRRADGVPARLGLMEGEGRQFYAPNCGHSRKPDGVHEWMEGLFPAGPFLELFARRERPGWSTWGLDTGFRLSEKGVEQVPPLVPSPQGSLLEYAP